MPARYATGLSGHAGAANAPIGAAEYQLMRRLNGKSHCDSEGSGIFAKQTAPPFPPFTLGTLGDQRSFGTIPFRCPVSS